MFLGSFLCCNILVSQRISQMLFNWYQKLTVPLLLSPRKGVFLKDWQTSKFIFCPLLLLNIKNYPSISAFPLNTSITVAFPLPKVEGKNKKICFLFILKVFSLSFLFFTGGPWWDFWGSEPTKAQTLINWQDSCSTFLRSRLIEMTTGNKASNIC